MYKISHWMTKWDIASCRLDTAEMEKCEEKLFVLFKKQLDLNKKL
jgi:hypothetical protein